MGERVVREAIDADVDAWVELRAEMFRSMGVEVDASDWRVEARRWFFARTDDVRIVVAEIDGEVVATAMGERRHRAPSPASPHGLEVLVSNVSTLAGARGRGHGGAVLEELMRWVREESGAERAELFATGDGQRLYERVGFAVHAWPAMRLGLVAS